jgi:hypothetical protein
MSTTHTEREQFAAGAAFRVYGTGLDIDNITHELGITPDHRHREGELDPGRRPYPHDMWSLSSPLAKDRDLDLHLVWLGERLLNRKNYILSLRRDFTVDIYCWKNCFSEQSGLTLPTNVLRIFIELNLDLGVSLLCLPPEPATGVQGGAGWHTLRR